MTLVWLLLTFVSLSAIGAVSLFRVARDRARRQLPVSATLEDHELVTITGQVRALHEIEAPISGRRCVAYVVRVRLYKTSYGMSSDEHWHIGLNDFDLEHETQVTFVEGDHYLLTLPLAEPARDEARERALLVALELDPDRVRYSEFEEGVLLDSDEAEVHGVAVLDAVATEDTSYRDGSPSFRITGTCIRATGCDLYFGMT